MDICLWRLNTTINEETVRSPLSFVSSREGIKHIVEMAHAISRTFRGGKNAAVSNILAPNDNTRLILVHDGDEEVARFELKRVSSEDSLIHFKMDHPYLQPILTEIGFAN